MKLELKEINKYFGEKHILKDVSFTVTSGKAMGFLGRNGAGKTTTIRILMDVFRQDSGSLLLDGKPFQRQNYRIGYLPEERGMYSKSTVLEQLVYFAMLRGVKEKEAKANAQYWLKRFDLDAYANQKLEVLSKGNQQKVQISQSFIADPEILILDEPFSGLDPVNAQVFKEALREFIEQGRLVIFSSHQMAYVEEFCDDVALIDQGKIILAGELQAIKRDWGKDKVRLHTKAEAELESLLEQRQLLFQKEQGAYLISLSDQYQKTKLLKELVEHDIEIDLFAEYQPKLEEIFVSKVGEHHA